LIRPEVEVRSYPRIHISLLEMNGGLGRVNGGLGFGIGSPVNRIRIRSARRSNIICNLKMDVEAIEYVRSIVNRVTNTKGLPECEVEVLQALPSHQGLGCFTSMGLAVVEGIFVHNGVKYTNDEVVALAHRGGTSGVGISTYFEGRLAVDLGHETKLGDVENFTPSSFAWKRGRALALSSIPMPLWPVLLLVPRTRRISENEEKAFFRKVCPLPVDEVARTIRVCFFGILPTVMTQNYSRFCEMLKLLRNTFWKRSEIALYSRDTLDIMERAEEFGADAASMSSMGPLVYCFARKSRRKAIMDRLKKEFDLSMTGIAYPRNRGRYVRIGSR